MTTWRNLESIMKFRDLAVYLKKLEETSSRNSMIEILAELFKISPASDIDKIVYLMQGRVAPLYNPLEFGMADKSLLRAIAFAYNASPKEALAEYKKIGDIGEVAQKLSSKSKISSSQPTVSEVFNELKKVAESGGSGSVERKMTLIANLLKSLDPLSARFVARIPVARLRLGFSDMTVLDSLSWMIDGSKSHRKDIEPVFNIRPDLGYIAKTIKEKGVRGLTQATPVPFTPILMAKAERLSSGEEIIKKIGKCAIEPKFDGFRCITGYTPIYVRNKGLISARYVSVGDETLTRTGVFKKVIAVNKRTIDKKEKLFKIQSFLGNEIKITEKHPMLVYRSGKEEWVNAENLTTNDYFIFPIPKVKNPIKPPNPHLFLNTKSGYAKTIMADEAFYKFLGFWIGDGFTNEFHNTQRVGLTFNEAKEKHLALEYKNFIKEKLLISDISEYSHNGGLSLYWRDEPFKNWLNTYFRREWKGKMLPEWFINISKERFKAFLAGWIDSDGTPRHSGGFKITTKESDLASFAQLIGLKFGIVIGLRRVRISGGTYFELIIPGTTKFARFENNRLIVKVARLEEIKDIDSRVKLYNFQVEKDESYCTSLIVLHNCQIHKQGDKVAIFTRNLENVTFMYPDVVEGVHKQIKAKEAIFEGEAIAYNPETGEYLPFQETVQRKRKYGIEEMAKTIPLKLMCFDLLYLNGKNLINGSYVERRKGLVSIIGKGDTVILSEEKVIEDPKAVEDFFNDAVSRGLEGILAKKLDGTYQAGARGWNWIKFKRSYSAKLEDTIDCLVMGYNAGRGKRTAFGLGAFLIGVYDKGEDKFVTVAKIGTGLTDDEWRELHKRAEKLRAREKPPLYEVDKLLDPDVWIEPDIVVETRADEITRSPIHTAGRVLKPSKSGDAFVVDVPGYALRFPRLERFRDDKKPEDVTSLEEVEEMFENQVSQKVKKTSE